MKKDSKKEKGGSEKVGALGGVFGCSVTAVIRRLGKETSTGHIREIMKAKGVKVSDTTVSIQANAGRRKDSERGEPAELTAAQVKELLSAAPDPATVKEKEEKK
jgi:hypothetical protein